jgi:DNA-binding response OmpR family regulator
MRVLVVDDDSCFRIPLRAMLALHGFHVETAASAGSAEALLEHEDFDAVLSDVGLPDIDGVALAARHPDVPFVLMSGSPPPERRASGSPRTERVRLVKPFDAADVIAALRAVANGRSAPLATSLAEVRDESCAAPAERPPRRSREAPPALPCAAGIPPRAPGHDPPGERRR